MANGGTLFLDEIGELAPTVQAKLLRVLEDQTFRRVGGVHDIEVDLRVIAATNRHLAEAVRDGKFRVDLFHRLSVIPIMLPPLRERRADIAPLAKHFTRDYAARYKSQVQSVAPKAIDLMMAYDWPGNVRELRNVIERAILLEDTDSIQPENIRFVSLSVSDPSHGPEATVSKNARPSNEMSLKDSERVLITRALEKTGGNQTKAALLLGITRDVLRYRIKKMGVTDTEPT